MLKLVNSLDSLNKKRNTRIGWKTIVASRKQLHFTLYSSSLWTCKYQENEEAWLSLKDRREDYFFDSVP